MTRTARLALTTLAVTLVVLLIAAASFAAGVAVATPEDEAARARPVGTAQPAAPTPPTRSARPSPASARSDLDGLIAARPVGTVSVAAVNVDTGARYSGGETSGQWLASVYKLLVLESLLNARGAAGPVGDERDLAAAMIRSSDNVAGYELYQRLGGDRGLAAEATTLGMRHTAAGRSDPAFTTSSAADCLRLLRSVASPGRLPSASRDYARDLLGTVQADQRWGVGVADDDGDFANKNGWLAVDDGNGPGENDGGRWIVNSVGIVESHGHRVLVAVLTQHGASMAAGVDLVEQLARGAVSVVA